MPPAILNRDESHLGYIDLNQKELRNPQLHQLASDPGTPVNGQILYRTDTHKIRARINGTWTDMATMADVTAGGITTAIVDLKGDLLAASAPDTVVREAVGANGTFYVANSAQPTGHEWRAFAATDIPNAAVSYSKIQNVSATDKLLGRDTAAAGVVEELGVDSTLVFTGAPGIGRAAITGDITIAAGTNTSAIAANVIVDGDISASAAIAATKLAFTPTGNIASNTVQGAIAELETDLTSLVSSSIQGFDWKEPVRAASTANLNLASPGAAIDGVTMAAGERFLAKDQSTGGQNGLYVWTGAASAATRSTDMDIAAEADNATVLVEAGTANQGAVYTQTATIATLGTTAMVWSKSSSSGAIYTADGTTLTLTGQQFSITNAGVNSAQLNAAVAGNGLTGGAGTALAVGAGSGITVAADAVAVDGTVPRRAVGALTGGANSEVLTHNLNTRDVAVMLRNNAAPYDEVTVYNEATAVNTVTVYAAAGGTLPAGYRWRVDA